MQYLNYSDRIMPGNVLQDLLIASNFAPIFTIFYKFQLRLWAGWNYGMICYHSLFIPSRTDNCLFIPLSRISF